MKKHILSAFCMATLFVAHAQSGVLNSGMTRSDLSSFANGQNSRLVVPGSIPSFNPGDETEGTRYLFNKWVHGSVVTVFDSLYEDPTTLFNYDKTTGALLMTQDKKKVIELDLQQLKSFTLVDENNTTYPFERVPTISSTGFFQPVVKNDAKYSLYKVTSTTFIPANYTTNGLSESGHIYNEYKDDINYYVVLPGGKDFKKIELKNKSIKKILAAEEPRVGQYLSSNSSPEVSEDFLKGLITELDK